MTSDLDRDLDLLREKLEWLRALDGRGQASSPGSQASFGASRHLHSLGPPLSTGELQLFEAAIRTRLPEDYRGFLLRLGNGGAGPYYGLAPLAIWFTHEEPITEGSLDEDALQAWYDRERPMRVADVHRDFVLDSPFYPLELTEKGRRHHYPPGGAHPFDGCVKLCDAGCGEVCFLVVRGARAGEVWMDQSQAAWPMRCVAPSFLSWYERHLDLTLGNALARAVRRSLVSGTSIAPHLLAAVGPLVEASGERARGATPAPQSDEDLPIGEAKTALAFLRLLQGRVEEAAARVSPLYIALATGGAEAALAAIAEAKERSSELLEIRARLLQRTGRGDDALDAWDAAIAASRLDPDLLRRKALLQLERGDRPGAEATLRRMVDARQGDRAEALESAAQVAEFADVLAGADAQHFRAFAERLRADAETHHPSTPPET